MRAPSAKRLVEAFKIEPDAARKIRRLAHLVNDSDGLQAFIEKHCPATHAYARSCHGDSFRTRIWRVTMALHAIDILVGGHGIEGLGAPRSGDYAPPYEYVNMGDPYVQTLIYKRETDNLYLGSWGSVVESNSSWCAEERRTERESLAAESRRLKDAEILGLLARRAGLHDE